jgi:hypothetical protein
MLLYTYEYIACLVCFSFNNDKCITFDKSFKRHFYIYGCPTCCYIQKLRILPSESTYLSLVMFRTPVILRNDISRLFVTVENYLVFCNGRINLAHVTFMNFILKVFILESSSSLYNIPPVSR